MELIVTIVFLSICVVPMLTMVSSSQVRANDSRGRMIALALAQDELDKQKTEIKKNPPTLGLLSRVLNGVTGLLTPANIKVEISATTTPKLYNVSVEVAYDGDGNKVTLATKVKSNG